MNSLFGTTFIRNESSMAKRTTDGIDYSLHNCNGLDVHLFDCEGFFSDSVINNLKENMGKKFFQKMSP
jgi:hypothetical protein